MKNSKKQTKTIASFENKAIKNTKVIVGGATGGRYVPRAR